jgi:hypothetical protein
MSVLPSDFSESTSSTKDNEKHQKKIHMFQAGDTVRICHISDKQKYYPVEYCPGSEECTAKNSFSDDAGQFAIVFNIERMNESGEYEEIHCNYTDDYSENIFLLLKYSIDNSGTSEIFHHCCKDVINYSLLGNEIADRLYENTKNEDLALQNFFPKSIEEVTSEGFAHKMEVAYPNEKLKFKKLMDKYNTEMHSLYHSFFDFQVERNREIRRWSHIRTHMKKSNECFIALKTD